MKKITVACVLILGTTFSAFSQTSVPSAPVNPLQQRLSPPAPSPAPAKMPVTETKTIAADTKSATKNAGAARRKQCSEEYQASKKSGTLAGQTWPKFYSACNKRLKGI